VAIVKRDRKASTSYIQRRLQIGYNRAASLDRPIMQIDGRWWRSGAVSKSALRRLQPRKVDETKWKSAGHRPSPRLNVVA
jgi:Ftsk gamma domain